MNFEVITQIVISFIVYTGLSFLLVRFLCRYRAKNFLAAKIVFGILFLGAFASLFNSVQAGNGVWWHHIEGLFGAIGSALGYFSGVKKHSA